MKKCASASVVAMLLTVCVAMTGLAGAAPVQSWVVGLDCYHRTCYNSNGTVSRSARYMWSQKTPGGYSKLGDLLHTMGARLATVKTAVDAHVLTPLSMFIICDPDTTHPGFAFARHPHYIQKSEIQALVKWVRRGGVLVLFANNVGNCEFTHYNQLADHFGIHFNRDTARLPHGGNIIPVPEANHNFKGVKKLLIVGMCSMTVAAPAKAVLSYNHQVLMATAKFGKGRVFAVGDPWLYNEHFNNAENHRAAHEVFHWLLHQAEHRQIGSRVFGHPQYHVLADIAPSPDPSAFVPTRGSMWLDKNGKITWLGVLREQHIKRGQAGPIGVLFFGDSLPNGWNINPKLKPVWNKYYGAWDPANFSQGDANMKELVEDVNDGEFDGISPKVVVLLCGGNSLPSMRAKVILRDNKKIVAAIRAKEPNTKILLLGLFPSGRDPKSPEVARLRAKIAFVNKGLAKLDNGKTIRFLNLDSRFVDGAGVQIKGAFTDGFHLSVKGYNIWAKGMQPLLAEMMK